MAVDRQSEEYKARKREYNKRWYQKHKAEIAAYNRKRRAEEAMAVDKQSEDKKAKRREYQKQWRQNHKAEFAVYRKNRKAKKTAYDRDNRERINKNRRERNKKNPELFFTQRAKRRAAKANCEINDLTAKQLIEVFDEYGWACYYCGATDVKLTMDHFAPLQRKPGGNNTKSNIRPACKSCNCSKNNHYIWEWTRDPRLTNGKWPKVT